MEDPLHLIMFDIDGTLVNSYGFDEDCYLKAANIVLGKDISPYWDEYTNATDAGILDEIIEMYTIPGNRNQIQQDFKQVFVNLIFFRNEEGKVTDVRFQDLTGNFYRKVE